MQLRLAFTEPDVDHICSEIVQRVRSGAQRIALTPETPIAEAVLSNLDSEARALVGEASDDALTVLCQPDAELLSQEMLNFLDAPRADILAPKTALHFSRKPLFLISIPKSGTHLLLELARALGFEEGAKPPENPAPGRWHPLEFTNSHTLPRDFFIDTTRRAPFGNRLHPFPSSPALFIYRHPLDILLSEAHHYHRPGRSPHAGYFHGKDLEARLELLADDPSLLGTLADRVGGFAAWLDFPNVIPVSYEELVGQAGGGDEERKLRLIWSLQLKLHVPGDPSLLGQVIYSTRTETFRQGKIGNWRQELPEHIIKQCVPSSDGSLERFGYGFNAGAAPYSSRIDEFRRRPCRVLDVDFRNQPAPIEDHYLGHNIISFRGSFFAIPVALGTIDLSDLRAPLPPEVLRHTDLRQLKAMILIKAARSWDWESDQQPACLRLALVHSPSVDPWPFIKALLANPDLNRPMPLVLVPSGPGAEEKAQQTVERGLPVLECQTDSAAVQGDLILMLRSLDAEAAMDPENAGASGPDRGRPLVKADARCECPAAFADKAAAALRAAGAVPDPGVENKVRLVQPDVFGYNILRKGAVFFAVDQSLGPVDLILLAPDQLNGLLASGRIIEAGSCAQAVQFVRLHRVVGLLPNQGLFSKVLRKLKTLFRA